MIYCRFSKIKVGQYSVLMLNSLKFYDGNGCKDKILCSCETRLLQTKNRYNCKNSHYRKLTLTGKHSKLASFLHPESKFNIADQIA